MKDQFRAASIQGFEFTYELAFKFMKRQLEQMASVPASVDEMSCLLAQLEVRNRVAD